MNMIATSERFTTDKRGSQTRTARHFDVGKKYANVLQRAKILPDHVCDTAIATCQFQIMGQFAHNDNGTALRRDVDNPWHGQGRWIHTKVQTYGFLPSNRFRRNGQTERAIWVVGDSFDAANTMLMPFNCDMTQVLHAFGNVTGFERKMIDLVDVIECLYAPYYA